MNRRYSLNQKINALNELEEHDGEVARVSKSLEIPPRTLRYWLTKEDDLRRSYRKRLKRQSDRLVADLHLEMLQRGKSILPQMDGETLSKADLNHLATALGSLVRHALKLEEAKDEIEEASEKAMRFEYFYDGKVQEAPPWAGASEGRPRSVQGGLLRETMGQDGAREVGSLGKRRFTRETGLVAGADLSDGESGLARLESERSAGAGHKDQRAREAD